MVRALQARGHTVDVLTSSYGLAPGAPAPAEPGVRRTLRIHGMFGFPWLGIFKLRELELHNNDTLRAELGRLRPDLVFVWNMGGLSKSMLFTLQASALPTVFFVSDHWVARCEKADVWLQWWNRRDASVPSRLLRAAWSVSGRRRRWQKTTPTNPVQHLRFPRIYFCSRALRDSTAAAGFDVRHGGVIYCPVDINRFAGPPRSAAQPLQKLLFVGRLHHDKGVMTALKAMALLRDKFPGQLDIYGRGEPAYEAELKAFAAKNKLPVNFSSVDNPDEMPRIYADHDALLFTSEWPEPFAITPLEAMANGLPVIATTTGGSGELFRNGQNSLTYAAGNHQDLARRIQELAENPGLRSRVATSGCCEVQEKFSEQKIVSQIEAYLQESLAGWRPPGLAAYDA